MRLLTGLLLILATVASAQWQTEYALRFDPNKYKPGVHYLVFSSDSHTSAVVAEIKAQAEQQKIPEWVGNEDKLFLFVSKPKTETIKIEVVYWGRLRSQSEQCPCVGGFFVIMKQATPKSIRFIMDKIKDLPRDNKKQIVVPSKTSA